MRKLILASLLAGTLLSAPAAHAQSEDLASLRAEIAALRAQVETLSARVQSYEETASQVQADTSASASPTKDEGISITFAGAPEIEGEGGWSFKPFGRIQTDAGFTSLPGGLGVEDGFGSEIRRARLGMEGNIPGGFGYKLEVDFAGSEVDVTDAIITYKDDGLTLTAGQHNNFQSLEELTSSRFTTFIERAAFTDAFGFERRLGFSAQYSSGPVLAQAGVFTDNVGDLPDHNWGMDGRLVVAPKLGDTQLHLGGSVHWANLESGSTVRYRQRPLVHFTGNRPLATPNLAANSEFGLGLEAAAIHGPLHIVGEAYWQDVDIPTGMSDPSFFGGYAEIGYYLTSGDKRGYKGGKFDRTRPANPIDEGGRGAWQINLRYDYLDMVDGTILGGKQNGYYASLVWVPTDYTRLLLNYGHLEYDDAVLSLPSGDRSWSADVLAVRGQIDF